MPSFVYWIRRREHSNIIKEGYVGVTSKSVEERWKEHISQSRSSDSRRKYVVHKAITGIGEENLVVDTVCIADEGYCYDLESKLRPSENIGWNVAPGGFKPPGVAGLPVSEETRARLSESLRGKKRTPQQIARWRKSYSKYEITPEHRRNLAKAGMGRKPSEKSIEALRERNRALKGKPKSQEVKDKIAATRLKNTRWWRFKDADQTLWSHADWLFERFSEGYTKAEMYNSFACIPYRWTVDSLWRHFEKGWIPEEDKNWVEDFRSEGSPEYVLDKSPKPKETKTRSRFKDMEKYQGFISLFSEGKPVSSIMRELGITKTTAYRYRKQYLETSSEILDTSGRSSEWEKNKEAASGP